MANTRRGNFRTQIREILAGILKDDGVTPEFTVLKTHVNYTKTPKPYVKPRLWNDYTNAEKQTDAGNGVYNVGELTWTRFAVEIAFETVKDDLGVGLLELESDRLMELVSDALIDLGNWDLNFTTDKKRVEISGIFRLSSIDETANNETTNGQALIIFDIYYTEGIL